MANNPIYSVGQGSEAESRRTKKQGWGLLLGVIYVAAIIFLISSPSRSSAMLGSLVFLGSSFLFVCLGAPYFLVRKTSSRFWLNLYLCNAISWVSFIALDIAPDSIPAWVSFSIVTASLAIPFFYIQQRLYPDKLKANVLSEVVALLLVPFFWFFLLYNFVFVIKFFNGGDQ